MVPRLQPPDPLARGRLGVPEVLVHVPDPDRPLREAGRVEGQRLLHPGGKHGRKAGPVAEPEIVLMFIEDEESEYKAKGYEPGDRFWHNYLREKTPGFALARYWAGHEAEVARLREEIERLRSLVKSAADVLERSGKEPEGWRLRGALDGR